MLSKLIDRFSFLNRRSYTGRGGQGERFALERMDRHFSQTELFYLAQAICSHVDPDLQANLNTIRTEVMEQILNGPTDIGAQVTTYKKPRLHWSDYQITPEFSFDLNVTGHFVSKATIKRLRDLHRRQIQTVLHAVQAYTEGK